MREAGGSKLHLEPTKISLTGPFHLWVLVLHSVKKVAEPGGLRILPGAVGVGSPQLRGLLQEGGWPFLLFPGLEKMSPG